MITKLRIPLVATFSPVAWKTTSALDPAARAIRDGADALASVATVRGVVKKTDMGALKNGQRRAEDRLFKDSPLAGHECPDDTFVLLWIGKEYVDGADVTGEEAGCNGKCCVGYKACHEFGGCIKRDGSCKGDYACAYGYNLVGIEASCNGEKACHHLGYSGTFGKLSNSCNGDQACYFMGHSASIGTVDESCNAKGACYKMAYPATGNLTIRSITGSCNSEKQRPCRELGHDYDPENLEIGVENLEIGDITAFKRNWRVKKTVAEDIEACIALCEEKRADDRDDCSGIKWRQGANKPCRLFKGGFTEGKCHDKDLCITPV